MHQEATHTVDVFDVTLEFSSPVTGRSCVSAAGERHHVEQLLQAPTHEITTCLIRPACCFVVYQLPEVNNFLENNLYPQSAHF